MYVKIWIVIIRANNGTFARTIRTTLDNDMEVIRKEALSENGKWIIIPEGERYPGECVFAPLFIDGDDMYVECATIDGKMYAPDFIDLQDFRSNLEENKMLLRPAPTMSIRPIPNSNKERGWTKQEMADMKANRSRAKEILDQIYGQVV